MRVNISAVNLYLECPRKWYYKYVLGRGVDEDAEALRLGTLWHAICAGDKEVPLDAPEWIHIGQEELLEWEAEHPDVEVLGNEVTVEAQLGEHVIFGRMDRVIRANGAIWHGQHKTMAASTPLGVYTRMIARSFHEHAYKHMWLHNHPSDRYGGTILFGAKKLTAPRKGQVLSVEYLPITEQAGLLWDLRAVIGQMSYWQTQHEQMGHVVINGVPRVPVQNPNACGGQWKNKLCSYVDVCDGRARISEMGTIDPLSEYKKA